MALEFQNKLEAINFGGLVVEPKVDIEKRLRLQNLELKKSDQVKEAIRVIAECFGENADKVEKYISENLSVIDIAEIQVYLIGGQKMLDQMKKKMEEE